MPKSAKTLAQPSATLHEYLSWISSKRKEGRRECESVKMELQLSFYLATGKRVTMDATDIYGDTSRV